MAEWRKATASADVGQCVEVATNLPGIVTVHASKDPNRPALVFTPGVEGIPARSRPLKSRISGTLPAGVGDGLGVPIERATFEHASVPNGDQLHDQGVDFLTSGTGPETHPVPDDYGVLVAPMLLLHELHRLPHLTETGQKSFHAVMAAPCSSAGEGQPGSLVQDHLWIQVSGDVVIARLTESPAATYAASTA
jgi:hypothetical protein